MALESATDISDLVETNPVDSTDTVASMGAHIRLIKSTAKHTIARMPILLATLTASSSASLSDTTSLTSAYKSYEIRLISIRPATDDAVLSFVVSTDAGANWKTDAHYWSAQSPLFSDATGAVYESETDTNGGIGDGISSAVNDLGLDGVMWLAAPSATGYKKFLVKTVNKIPTPDSLAYWHGAISYRGSTSAINGIKYAMDSGNIADGSIEIWGLP